MVLYDLANSGSVGAFFMARYGFRSMGESALFQGMGMESSGNTVLRGSKKEHHEYGSATGMSCWAHGVSDDSHPTSLSGPTVSKADSRAGDPCSFPRRGDPQPPYCAAPFKKQGRRSRRTNLVIWVAGSVSSAGMWVSMARRKVLHGQLKCHLMRVWWKKHGGG